MIDGAAVPDLCDSQCGLVLCVKIKYLKWINGYKLWKEEGSWIKLMCMLESRDATTSKAYYSIITVSFKVGSRYKV